MKNIEGHGIILLVVAHPDDEVMFFSPILERLVAKKVDTYLYSLSNGNADGLGVLRTKEFVDCANSMGISSSYVEVVDHPNLQDGMKNVWSEELISNLVFSKAMACKADLIITFDEYGVSYHPNHISVFHGTQRALKQLCTKRNGIHGLKLISKNIVRKFSGPLDILVSLLFGEFFIHKLSPLKTILGMLAHASQFVWYRRLFVIFSCYTYVNSFLPLISDP